MNAMTWALVLILNAGTPQATEHVFADKLTWSECVRTSIKIIAHQHVQAKCAQMKDLK